MLTFASANVPLTAQEDKDFNYFDKVLHQNTLPVREPTGAGGRLRSFLM